MDNGARQGGFVLWKSDPEPWQGVRSGSTNRGQPGTPVGRTAGLLNEGWPSKPPQTLNGPNSLCRALENTLTRVWKPARTLPPAGAAASYWRCAFGQAHLLSVRMFTSVTGEGWTNPVGLLPHDFFHYCFFFLLNEFLHGPPHGSHMKVELFCLKLGCLSGSSCSPRAAPKVPSFFRSQCEHHWIRLSSRPCQLCNYTPWWGSRSRVLCLCSSHLYGSAPTG